jgi:hypothetical protein
MILNKPVSWPRLSKNEIRNVLKPTSIRLLGVSKRYPKDPTLKKVRSEHADRPASSTLTWSGAVEESIADEDGIHAREVWQSMSSKCISPEFLRHHIDKEWDFRKLGKHNP